MHEELTQHIADAEVIKAHADLTIQQIHGVSLDLEAAEEAYQRKRLAAEMAHADKQQERLHRAAGLMAKLRTQFALPVEKTAVGEMLDEEPAVAGQIKAG